MKIRTKLILIFSFFVILFLLFGMVINILFEKQVKEHALIHAEIYSHSFALTIGRETENNKTPPIFYNRESLEDYIQDIHLIQKIDLVVVDTAKTIVADVMKSEIGKKYTYDKNNEVLLTMQDDSDRTFKEISSDYPHGILLYVHPIKNENGKTLGAVLIEFTPLLKESEANIKNVRQIILYAILFSIFVSIAFGFIISKKITGSIADVVNAARKFSHGDYSVRIQTKSKDELGELGKAFNQMVEQKQKSDEQVLFLGNALKYANDMISIADINFNIIYVNDSFCKAYGYTEEEVRGKSVDLFISEKNKIELNKIANPNIFSKRWLGEQWSKTKSGKDFLIELHISPVKNTKDEVIATIAVSNDITSRKHTEAILKHNSDQLKLLNEIGRDISSSLELDQILDLAARLVHERFGYDHVALFI
ncbi:MAG: PAS domain S-box protein [Ignavibacteriaceae bacterium]